MGHMYMVKIIQISKEYLYTRFGVEDHADGIRSSSSNQRLYEQRASANQDFLITKGISSNRFVAKDFGEDKPIAAIKQGLAGKQVGE